MNDNHYFQLPISGQDNPVFRERVYCYELYHQMRTHLGNDFQYKLDGEVDKNGHPAIPKEIKPDFIVHVPGNMEQNLVVMEVKPVTADKDEFEHDLKKLEWILANAKYYKAIMLLYGDGKTKVPINFVILTRAYSEKNNKKILLAWHEGRGKEILLCGKLGIPF